MHKLHVERHRLPRKGAKPAEAALNPVRWPRCHLPFASYYLLFTIYHLTTAALHVADPLIASFSDPLTRQTKAQPAALFSQI